MQSLSGVETSSQPAREITHIPTLWFALVFGLTVLPCCLVGWVLWLVTAPFDPAQRVLHAYVCRWCFLYLRVWPGWSARVEGRELLPSEPCVLVANHQSVADIFACMGLFHPFKFVSKASLFRVPVVGWMMRLLRYVPLERGQRDSMERLLESCHPWLRQGMSLLIFPEGTYSTGGQLLPFKRGAFRLAMEARVPVVPVVVRGTRELVVKDGPWMGPRARVHVRVLPPILPSEFGADEVALTERVRGIFLSELSPQDVTG
jgi:1-acyl-sn-glycerol-3-phosphate acyltransferase